MVGYFFPQGNVNSWQSLLAGDKFQNDNRMHYHRHFNEPREKGHYLDRHQDLYNQKSNLIFQGQLFIQVYAKRQALLLSFRTQPYHSIIYQRQPRNEVTIYLLFLILLHGHGRRWLN